MKDIFEDILFVFSDLRIQDIAVIVLMGIAEVIFMAVFIILAIEFGVRHFV